MRTTSLWLCLLIGACDAPPMKMTIRDPGPDAVQINCDASSFTFQAPRPDLHYDPNLVVIADMLPYYASNLPGVVCIDDLGTGYEPTSAPASAQLDNGQIEMQWTFALAPSHRYTLYFSATECDQQESFFTSGP